MFGDWISPEGSTSLSRGTISDDGSTLMFTALESDTGSFRCSAMNSEGETDSGSEEILVGKQWSCVIQPQYYYFSSSHIEWTNGCKPGVP